MLLRHVAFILHDGFQDCIRLYCVFVIYLIIFYDFFINVNFLTIYIYIYRFIFYKSIISARCFPSYRKSGHVLESVVRIVKYRVSIKAFPDYKHLLQENYVEYNFIFKI